MARQIASGKLESRRGSVPRPADDMQFLESFANRHISSSEDRLEETKRRKLAKKSEKLVELMMVSAIPTASGYEERIQFSELEVVERGANEQGLLVNTPDGHVINGWDINVAGVRTTSVKRTVRYHQHAVRNPIPIRRSKLTVIGIHLACQASQERGSIYWSKVRRICKTTQEAAGRITWQSARSPAA